MEGKNKGNNSPFKFNLDFVQEGNRNVPRGLLFRELGHKQKLGAISQEFQAIAEEKLVLKPHKEMRCELPGPSRSTFLMVFSPDGTKVASTHGNHNVYVTDLTSGKNVNTLSGHPRTPWCIAFHPSSNQILASGCLGGQVRVWDLHGGSEVWMADGQTVIASLAFHPTERMLVIATYNELHFWDWSQPEPFTKCYTNNEKEKVRYVAFDLLGHKLITGISNAPQVQSQWDQWDRVPSNNPGTNSSSHSPQHRNTTAPDRERRISACYRSLVEQYEQLVQRYFDLSRSRSISTMDRGTDPMDFESETSIGNNHSQTPSEPSTSRNDNGSSINRGNSHWRERIINSMSCSRASSSNSSSSNYLQSLFHSTWQRNCRERAASQTESALSEVEQGAAVASDAPGTSESGGHRSDQTQLLSSVHQLDPRPPNSNRSHASPIDSIRRRLNTSLESPSNQGSVFQDRDAVDRQDNQNSTTNESRQSRPNSPVFLPSVPRHFYVSQSSAFQPRAPRSDHSSEPRNSGRSVLPRRTARISLNHATAAAVAAVPERPSPDWEPSQPQSPLSFSPIVSVSSRSTADMADIGVRYGIQLLSRHIDNMQRLCRARLEILQLQQIRRMWEDLQQQIRSLHSAVRESSITLSRLADSSSLGPQYLGAQSAHEVRQGSFLGQNRFTPDGNNDGNSGHIPSVSQMLELARISDNSPANNSEVSSPDLTEDSSRLHEEVFEPPGDSSHLESASSGSSSLGRSSTSSSALSEEARTQQYSYRCQMLQQRLWRISRKVYLRRPRLLTVGSRSTRRHLHSNHPSVGRSNSSQSRHGDCGKRPWFLHTARNRIVPKRTNNMSSQATCSVDPSCSPEKSEERKKKVSESAGVSMSNSVAKADDSQAGPSGLCTKAKNLAAPAVTEASQVLRRESVELRNKNDCDKVYDNNDDNDDDDDDYNDNESGGVDDDNCNEQEPVLNICSLKHVSDNDEHSSFQRPTKKKIKLYNNCSEPDLGLWNPNEAPNTVKQKLPEGVDKLSLNKVSSTSYSPSSSASTSSDSSAVIVTSDPSMSDRVASSPPPPPPPPPLPPPPPPPPPPSSSSSSCTPASTPSTSTDHAEPSTSQGTTTRENQCKSLWAMIGRLERLLQIQRDQRDRLRNVLSDQGQSHRTNTWSLRDRIERLENSGSDSDSSPESERPQNWSRMSAEERLLSALQAERYERERMCRAAAGGEGSRSAHQDEEWEWTRESTRLRARQVLSLMVESLTQFFEENGLSSNTPHSVLDEQIINLHVLLQLALELTDLLLAQLVSTRRELERQWVHRLRSPVAVSADDPHSQDSDRERPSLSRGRQEERNSNLRRAPYRCVYRPRASEEDRSTAPEQLPHRGSRTDLSRRLSARVMNCLARHNQMTSHSGNARNTNLRSSRSSSGRSISRSLSRSTASGHISSHFLASPRVILRRLGSDSTNDVANMRNDNTAVSSNDSDSSPNIPSPQSQDAFTVPLVRVNDVLIPDTSLLNQPRTRPQSPPLIHPHSPFANPFPQAGAPELRPRSSPWEYWPYVPGSSFRSRFLHPRYMGPNIFNEDTEEPAPNPDFGYFRANTIPEAVFITDAPMAPNHRIQVWDFSKFQIPDISNAEKNVIVPECKIQNDASVDVSKDGRLLVTLLPSGRQSITTMLGVYSLQWESLGQCLYTTSFLQSAVSVSLSPASRYLLVGLASRRVALLPNDRHCMAQVFRLDGGKPGLVVGGRGRLRHMRDIEQIRDHGYMSLNCIRWAPGPGQGFVYGTNTGQLRVLR